VRPRFEFHGHRTSIDLPVMIHGEPAFVGARRRMIDELGMSEGRAQRILEDMLGSTLLRYGDHLVARKSALIDRVIDLRDRLDTLYHSLLTFRRRDGSGGRVDSSATIPSPSSDARSTRSSRRPEPHPSSRST